MVLAGSFATPQPKPQVFFGVGRCLKKYTCDYYLSFITFQLFEFQQLKI